MNRFAALTVTLVTLTSSASCMKTQPPVNRLVTTSAAVRDARTATAQDGAAPRDAREDRDAVEHLRLAEDQLARAETLITKGDNERAAWLLAQSEADANLALELERGSHLPSPVTCEPPASGEPSTSR